MEERILKSHKISLFNRSSGIISGVKEVISFDPNEIILDTEQGMLTEAGRMEDQKEIELGARSIAILINRKISGMTAGKIVGKAVRKTVENKVKGEMKDESDPAFSDHYKA